MVKGILNTPITLICSVCGRSFESRTNRQKSCHAPICSNPECKKQWLHLWYKRTRFKPCPECSQPMFRKATNKVCRACYTKKARGENSPVWKGGRTTTGEYIKVKAPEHHRADKQGYVLEHIKVWEEYSGKELSEGWIIHHINGIKTDNSIGNLLAMPRSSHNPSVPKIILDAYKRRIRHLEAEIKVLEQSLPDLFSSNRT